MREPLDEVEAPVVRGLGDDAPTPWPRLRVLREGNDLQRQQCASRSSESYSRHASH